MNCADCGGHIGAWWGIFPPPKVCICDHVKVKIGGGEITLIPSNDLPGDVPMFVDMRYWQEMMDRLYKRTKDGQLLIGVPRIYEDEENPLMRAF